MSTRLGGAVPAGCLTLILITGCAGDVTSPATTQALSTHRLAESISASGIMIHGAAQSEANRIASIFAAQGDSTYMHQLESGRRRHIVMLDSVLRGDAKLKWATPLSYEEEVVILNDDNLGQAEVLGATTSVGFGNNGTSVSLTGQVSLRATEADIKVMYSSANFTGSRPPDIPYDEEEASKTVYFQLQPDCVRANPANLRACPFGGYAELTVPSRAIGQPCGTRVTGQTEAVARWDFGLLEALLSAAGINSHTIGVGIPSAPFRGPSRTETNAACIPPVVRALLGGFPFVNGAYQATLPNGSTTYNDVFLYGVVDNMPLPSDLHYVLTLDGIPVTASQGNDHIAQVDVGVGMHTFQFTAIDDLLELSGSASVAFEVKAHEECTESGQGAATIRAFPALGNRQSSFIGSDRLALLRAPERSNALCGQQTGTPGGDAGDPPPGGGEPNCYWARWFVVWIDGSWDWLGNWERVCDGDQMLRMGGGDTADPSLFESTSSAGATRQLRVRLMGGGSLGTGKPLEIHRLSGTDVDAVIRVDTLTATAADLEAAIGEAKRLAAITKPGHNVALISPMSTSAKARFAQGSRAANFLRSLARSREMVSGRFGKVRSLDILIDATGSVIAAPTTSRHAGF